MIVKFESKEQEKLYRDAYDRFLSKVLKKSPKRRIQEAEIREYDKPFYKKHTIPLGTLIKLNPNIIERL